VHNNHSQKMVENPNNGIRKSSGYFNSWGIKGEKHDKNKSITPVLKESHSIPNFQSQF